MLIYPAIDLRGGLCVRLQQGDYAKETVFDSDPVSVARKWQDQGAYWLHLVDLDGAKAGRSQNGTVIERIRTSVRIPCQMGGGLRTDTDVETAFGWGVERIVIGTRALQDPAWLRSLCERYPHRVALGLDARDGFVASHGWLETSHTRATEVARQVSLWPLAAIIYTDIRRDGMLEGPNFEALAEMQAVANVPVIASGGVTSVDDVRRLRELNMSGCIIGRALYEGRIDLPTALRAASGTVSTT
jgi:phosphoribosylformimino-5-aminoimidazole carboxamide ribotide isomerase